MKAEDELAARRLDQPRPEQTAFARTTSGSKSGKNSAGGEGWPVESATRDFKFADTGRLHLPLRIQFRSKGYADAVVGAKGNRTPDLSHVVGVLCH